MKYYDNTNIIKIAMFEKSKISNPFKVEIFPFTQKYAIGGYKGDQTFFWSFFTHLMHDMLTT